MRRLDITTEFWGYIPQSRVLRSVVLGRNWAIRFRRFRLKPSFKTNYSLRTVLWLSRIEQV